MWRPILEGVATLQEIETHYNLLDLLDANEILDIRQEADRKAMAKMKAKMGDN